MNRRLPIALHLALFLGLTLPASSYAAPAEIGKPPPRFALADENGEIHRVEDFRGKPVVIYFTHNMCHYCTQVIAFLKRAHEAYEGRGLTILTINVCNPSSNMLLIWLFMAMFM